MNFKKILEISNKLIEFDEFYLFDNKEKWGTKKDWAKYLYNGDYNSSFITKYINKLIKEEILIKNKKVEINGTYCQTFKLGKKYVELIYKQIIEEAQEMKYIDELYKLTRKYVGFRL